MRKAYFRTPKDYVDELKNEGHRFKSMAFQDYNHDKECERINSIGFYAIAWNKSKSTVHAWIKEFEREIALFNDHWILRNARQYTHAENQAERLPNDSRTILYPTVTENTEFEEKEKTTAERLPNKALNINTTTNPPEFTFAEDGNFNTQYGEMRLFSGKYLGGKEKAYKSYLRVKEYLDIKVITRAYRAYISDLKDDENRVGLSTFLDNEIYLPYLPKQISVVSENGDLEGIFENEVLTTHKGNYEFKYSRFLEKLKNKEIKFI